MRKCVYIITILLIIVIALTACGKEPDIICGNCAATVPGDSFFCPNCGTEFFQGSTTAGTSSATETTGAAMESEISTTPNSAPAEPENAPEQTAPAVQKQPETTHVHNFSGATCLMPQTCSCGATTGGLADHSFRNYVCDVCGTVDRANAYHYFILWITAYGNRQNDLYRIDMTEGNDMYSLVYDCTNQCIYISLSFEADGTFYFSSLWLNDYSCATVLNNILLEGYLNPETFTEYTSVTLSGYTGDAYLKDACLNYTNTAVCNMLDWLDDFLYYNDVGFTLADLGFTVF